jgi:hypothetical protein
MSHNLEAMSNEDPNVAARTRHVLTGPQSQINTAVVDRVDTFVAQAKAKMDRWFKK